MERATDGRDVRAPTSRLARRGVDTVLMTSDLVLTVLAGALIGFAASVAAPHLPSLVPALRRAVDRDRR